MKTKIAVAGAVLALSPVPAAFAADSVTNAYGGSGTSIPDTVVPPPADTGSGTTSVETGQGGAPTVVVAGETASSPGTAVAPGAGTLPIASSAPVASMTPTEAVASGSLPFTGLDIGLMALGGALLLGLGLAMRRLSGRTAPLA